MDLVLTQEVVYLLKNYSWNMKIPFKMVPLNPHIGFWGSQQQWQMNSTCPPIFSYRSCAVPVAVIISSYWTWIFSQCLQAWQQATNTGNRTNLGVAPLSKRLVTGEGAHLVWFAGYDLGWKTLGRQKTYRQVKIYFEISFSKCDVILVMTFT